MKDVCFYTCFDEAFKDTGQGLVNSIKHFYPDIPVIVCDVPKKDGKFDLQTFCSFHLKKGLELLDEYERVIYIDCDSVMCDKCEDLFGSCPK